MDLEPHKVHGPSGSASNSGPAVPHVVLGTRSSSRMNIQQVLQQRCHWNSQNAAIFYQRPNRIHYQTHFVFRAFTFLNAFLIFGAKSALS